MKSRDAIPVIIAGLLASVPAVAQRGPSPTMLHMDPEVLALACAPRMTFDVPPMPLHITGGQDSTVRRTFGEGDLVTINAGADNGIEVGQEYYVRRLQPEVRAGSISRTNPATIRTAGWIRIYAVDPTMSLATIVHGCDTIDEGDFLETFKLPEVATPADTANIKPQKSNYGKILLGTDRRRSFAKGDFFIVDRGSDHGVTVGSRFVIFHDKKQPENFLYELGEAIAVDVKSETSTLQVTLSRDAFSAGDLVAIRK